MKPIERIVVIIAFALLFSIPAVPAQTAPPVTTMPDSFFEMVRDGDRDAAGAFYKKFIDVKGMPVVSAVVVADLELHLAAELDNAIAERFSEI